jgi:hypothetical protein
MRPCPTPRQRRRGRADGAACKSVYGARVRRWEGNDIGSRIASVTMIDKCRLCRLRADGSSTRWRPSWPLDAGCIALRDIGGRRARLSAYPRRRGLGGGREARRCSSVAQPRAFRVRPQSNQPICELFPSRGVHTGAATEMAAVLPVLPTAIPADALGADALQHREDSQRDWPGHRLRDVEQSQPVPHIACRNLGLLGVVDHDL